MNKLRKFSVVFTVFVQIPILCALIAGIVHNQWLSSENQRLKNKLADANLRVDMANANAEHSRAILGAAVNAIQKGINDAADDYAQKVTAVAVNEKQGAHQFIFVDADSWVDLSNGEKVPAMKKIAVELGDSTHRWKSGLVTFEYNGLSTGGRNQ